MQSSIVTAEGFVFSPQHFILVLQAYYFFAGGLEPRGSELVCFLYLLDKALGLSEFNVKFTYLRRNPTTVSVAS